MYLTADKRRQTQTFYPADLAGQKPASPPGSCEWFVIAKRSHLLAPQVAELKTHAAECERLWWIDYVIPPTLGILGNLVHFRHFILGTSICRLRVTAAKK